MSNDQYGQQGWSQPGSDPQGYGSQPPGGQGGYGNQPGYPQSQPSASHDFGGQGAGHDPNSFASSQSAGENDYPQSQRSAGYPPAGMEYGSATPGQRSAGFNDPASAASSSDPSSGSSAGYSDGSWGQSQPSAASQGSASYGDQGGSFGGDQANPYGGGGQGGAFGGGQGNSFGGGQDAYATHISQPGQDPASQGSAGYGAPGSQASAGYPGAQGGGYGNDQGGNAYGAGGHGGGSYGNSAPYDNNAQGGNTAQWAAQPPANQQGPGGDGGHGDAPTGSLFANLFDVTFSKYATPALVKIYFIVGIVLAGLFVLGYVIVGAVAGGNSVGAGGAIGFGLLALIGTGVTAFFMILAIRLQLEMTLAIVRLNQDSKKIRELLEQRLPENKDS